MPIPTSQAVSDKVCGQGNQDLVAEVTSVLLIEVLRQHLGPDDVLRVRQALGSVGHNSDEHMFLFVEPAGIQAVLLTEDLKPVIRHPSLPRLSDREGQQLGDIGLDTDERLADTEQLMGRQNQSSMLHETFFNG
jgi:hypothetical protein